MRPVVLHAAGASEDADADRQVLSRVLANLCEKRLELAQHARQIVDRLVHVLI